MELKVEIRFTTRFVSTQEDEDEVWEFVASLGYVVRPCLKSKTKPLPCPTKLREICLRVPLL